MAYDQDGLNSVHNADFMSDPRFLRAYARGVKAAGVDYFWHWRVHVGLWAARTAIQIPGDFIEFGTNRGFLSSAIMEDLDWNATGRRFLLLDTFAGLDKRFITEEEKLRGILDRNRQELSNGFYTTDVEGVRLNFSQWANVEIIAGSVPTTLDQISGDRFAFVHIDMNCSPPEVAALRFIWPKLSESAVVLLDDYAYIGYEPQKKGMDELGAELGFDVLSLPTGQGLIVRLPSKERFTYRRPVNEVVQGPAHGQRAEARAADQAARSGELSAAVGARDVPIASPRKELDAGSVKGARLHRGLQGRKQALSYQLVHFPREAGQWVRATGLRLAFHSNGTPRRLVRRSLFHSDGRVRGIWSRHDRCWNWLTRLRAALGYPIRRRGQ